MKKIVHAWATEILLEGTEPSTICRLGQGEACCAFLVCGPGGFMCLRMSYPASGPIWEALEKDTMKAKGRGEWFGCPWSPKEKPTYEEFCAAYDGEKDDNAAVTED